MLETVKSYIEELPDISFDTYYQRYIFQVQDQNIATEIHSINTDDILSLDRLIAKLSKELHDWVV